MKTRAAIYARYSSHNQREESIEIQLEAAHRYCEDNGLSVVGAYCDYAKTGRSTNRAQFQRLLRDAEKHLFDYVVIYKVTRIMRNRDEMAIARSHLKKCGVEILYAGEDIPTGSGGVLHLGLLEVLAEYESALDSERIRDGIQKNAKRCMANGHPMFGWDIVDGRYVINEFEAEGVRMAYRMLFSGSTVAEILEALKPYPTKRGKGWRHNTVTRLLQRRQNGGEYRYAGHIEAGGIPAIVPMSDVERATMILARRSKPQRVTSRDEYPLTGRLTCTCGGNMRGVSGTGRSRTYHYYQCAECGRRIRREKLEGMVMDAISDTMHDEALREKLADMIIDYQPDEEPMSGVLKSQLKEVDTSIQNIWTAIEKGVEPLDVKDRIDDLKERQLVLKEELRIAEAVEAVHRDRDQVLFWLENIADHDPREILSIFVRAVIAGPDGVQVSFTYEEDPVRTDSFWWSSSKFIRTIRGRKYAFSPLINGFSLRLRA